MAPKLLALQRAGRAAAIGLAVLAFPGVSSASEIDIAAASVSWPEFYDLRGTKTEPTWVESVRLVRQRDLFVLEGGGLHDGEQAVEAMRIDAAGGLRHVACPPEMDCTGPPVPAGFLASVALLAALRSGRVTGSAPMFAYGDRRVFCLAGERLGIEKPVLDPCFDVATGAVLAQRDRASGTFSGPSLDPVSVRYEAPDRPSMPLNRLD